MDNLKSLLFSTLFIVGLCCCNSPQREHFIINENDTIASMIERSDSLVKIDIHKYDFKNRELNKDIIDFFDIDKNTNIYIKDSYKRDWSLGGFGRHNLNPNGYKLFLTGKLDTIAYLAFNNYSVGTYVKTSSKIEDENIREQIMDVFNLDKCDFYINEGNGIADMNIYSHVDFNSIKDFKKIEESKESQNDTNGQFEEEIYEDDSIVIPAISHLGLKNLISTLRYFDFILSNVFFQDYIEEEHSLYRSIALRDIGEFAIKCMISSDEEVREKATEIISYLDEHQESIIKNFRFKLYNYYLNNMKYYDLHNVEIKENPLNSRGDMVYSLYLHSSKFTSEDYCKRLLDRRDNIFGYSGFNNVCFVGSNGFYSFPVYSGADLKPNQIGWPEKYDNYKRKSLQKIINNIERFYNPF